jgi:hypothetical protein
MKTKMIHLKLLKNIWKVQTMQKAGELLVEPMYKAIRERWYDCLHIPHGCHDWKCLQDAIYQSE